MPLKRTTLVLHAILTAVLFGLLVSCSESEVKLPIPFLSRDRFPSLSTNHQCSDRDYEIPYSSKSVCTDIYSLETDSGVVNYHFAYYKNWLSKVYHIEGTLFYEEVNVDSALCEYVKLIKSEKWMFTYGSKGDYSRGMMSISAELRDVDVYVSIDTSYIEELHQHHPVLSVSVSMK